MLKNEKFSLVPYYYGFIFVLLTDGFIFLKSSFGKISEGKFVPGLTDTLNKFLSKNPYPWYKDFLSGIVIPNSQLFGQLIMWGEFLSSVAIIVSIICLLIRVGKVKIIYTILILGLTGAFLLNLNFYLAAGWTSASTESLNLIMGIIALIGLAETTKLLLRSESFGR